MDKLIGSESSGQADAANPNSSAEGLGQFIDATWVQTVKDHAPDIAGQYTRAEIIEMKIDTSPEGVEFQRKMLTAFSDDNRKGLEAAGIEVTDGSLYLAHFAGLAGAKKLLKADPQTPVVDVLGEAAVKANPFLKDMTAGDLIGWAGRKMSGESTPMVAPGERVQPDMFGGPDVTEEDMAARETFEQRVAEVEAGEGDLFGLYMEYVADPGNAEAKHGIERLEAQGALGKGFVEAPDFKTTFPLPIITERAGEFGISADAAHLTGQEQAFETVAARFEEDGERITDALKDFETARKAGDLAAMRGHRDRIAAIEAETAAAYGPDTARDFLAAHGAKMAAMDARIRRTGKMGEGQEIVSGADAPTLAEFNNALPKDTEGRPDVIHAASRVMKKITGKLGANWSDLTPEQRVEAVELAKGATWVDPKAGKRPAKGAGQAPDTEGKNGAKGSSATKPENEPGLSTDAVPTRSKKTRKRPAAGRPQSLLRWLADNGGLRDDGGDLAALDAQLWHRSAREAGERGARPRLVRDDGRDIGRAAEAAFETGYIPDKENNTLLDAIAREMGGERIVAGPDQADEQRWLDTQAEREAADEAARLIKAATEKVKEALTVEWGGMEMTRREIAAIAEQVADGVDVNDAIDHWIIQEAEYVEGQDDTAEGDDIPGFEAAGAENAVSESDAEGRRNRGAVGPGQARGQDDRREAGASGEEVAATSRPAEDAGPDGGTQTVIAGAERITDKELAERRMRGAKSARVAQRAPAEDGGLFDSGERNQGEMFLTDATGSEAFQDTPMPGHQPLYRNMSTPPRPANDLIEIGDRTVKLRPMHRPTRREGIRILLEDTIGPRVYQGKVKGKARLGFYRHENAEVRIKDFDDVEVMAHEMAHWLDFHGSMDGVFTAFRNDERFKSAIEQFSYTTVKGKVSKEGFAEFVRLWLTRRHVADAMAPDAVAEFERLLARRPKLNRKMRRLQEEMHKWFLQGDLASGRAKIGSDLTPAEANMKLMQSAPLIRARNALVDRFHGIKVAERTIHGDVMPGALSASKQMQLLGGAEGIFEAILRFGTPRMTADGGLEFRGKSLNDIFWKIAKLGNKAFDDAMHYFAARRAAELKEQGRENLFADAEIEAGLALGEGRPEFEEAFEEFQQFNGEMLDFYVEMGLISEDQREAFQAMNANYVPFNRIIEALEDGGKGRGRTIGARLTGGDRNIRDVAVNITESLFFNIRAALIARAKRTLFTDVMMSEAGAEFAARIGTDSRKVRAELSEMTIKVAQILSDLGLAVSKDGMIGPGGDIDGQIIDVAEIEANLAAHPELLEFWLHGQKPTTLETYVDSAVIDGKRTWFEVRDPALVDSLTHLGGLNISPWIKPLLWPADMVRRTVTTMPPFILGNFARDTGSGFVLSRNFMLPVIGTLHGMTGALFKSKDFKLFMLNGGTYGTRILANTEETRARRQLDAQRSGAIHMALRGFAAWDHLLSATEIGTRLEEFRLARKRGKDTIEATWEGRDVTVDFSKRGSVEVVAQLIRTVPFMQPAIQGIDKFVRSQAEIKGKMTLANLVLFDRNKARVYPPDTVAAIFWLKNRKPEEWRDRGDQSRRISFDAPEMTCAKDASRAMADLISAVAKGDLTPSQGAVVAGLIDTFRRTLESEELERRITNLEARKK